MTTTVQQIRTVDDYLQIARELRAAHIRRYLGILVRPITVALRRAAMRRQLERLDDRLLADIGLSRGDIPGLVSRAYGTERGRVVSGMPADVVWLVPSLSSDRAAGRAHRLAA